MKRSLFLLPVLLVVLVAPAMAFQQEPAIKKGSQEKRRANIQKWNRLPAEEKARFRQLFRSFQKLSPERRKAIRKQLRALGLNKGRAALRHHRRLQNTDPKKREDLRRRHESLLRWRWHLPEKEQARLRGLPMEQHRAAMKIYIDKIRSDLLSKLSEEERRRIQALPRPKQDEQLRKHLPPPKRPPRVVFRVMRELQGLPRERVNRWLTDHKAIGGDPEFPESLKNVFSKLTERQIQQVREALQRDRKRTRVRGGAVRPRDPGSNRREANPRGTEREGEGRQRPGRGRGRFEERQKPPPGSFHRGRQPSRVHRTLF